MWRSVVEVGGYVLAGGQSARMGRNKALLRLAGKPLIEHAVRKLRRVCAEVSILGNGAELGGYGPLVPDVHPGCGPVGGIEAALLHTRHTWNLFLPVDVPFLPTAYLLAWVEQILPLGEEGGARVFMFSVGEVPQPALALVHRDVRPFLTQAIADGDRRLFPVLRRAAVSLAERDGFPPGAGLWKLPFWAEFFSRPGPMRMEEPWRYTTPAQERGNVRWFANLNTPEEFAEAERHTEELDT